VTGDHDHRRRNLLVFEVLEDFDAVEHGHLDVEQDRVVRNFRRLVDAFLSRSRFVDPVALVLEGHANRFADGSFVVDD
jgi:hypothetical protein